MTDLSDLSDLLIRIQIKRGLLQKTHPDIDARLVRWGLLVIRTKPIDPLPSWWWVRQMLPEEALVILEAKLDQALGAHHA